MKAKPKNPNKVFPHPYPKLAYRRGAVRGKNVPNRDRRSEFAARAEAAVSGPNASTRYIWEGN
jgi:hypothetical protein